MSCSSNSNSCSNPISVTRKSSYVRDERSCFQLNKEIKLKVILTDDCGNLINADDGIDIVLRINQPDDVVFVVNNINIIKADDGFYYATYTPTLVGDYTDTWRFTVNGQNVEITNKFTVKNGGTIQALQNGLDFNSLILIELDSTIADTDGNTLNTDQFLSFTTEYNPFYCSVEMVRMEMGTWVDLVPDDTIALAIHWSSLEANNITGVRPSSERYYHARSKFVMYDTALRLFAMPIGTSSPGSGKQKQLGDLLIENGSSLDFNIKDLIMELRLERDEWWRVVNAGGCIVNGQGLGPTMATKGGSIKEKIKRSREWHDPWNEHYIQPTQNSKYRKKGESKYKSGYTGWNEYYFTSVSRGIRKGRR